jgi:Carboxypeptidase regulatory-like domain
MKPRQLLSFFMIALFLSPAGLRSQQNATVQGNLIKLGSNEPVARATLELKDTEAAASAPYTTTSDQNGTFSFRNVPPGPYRLTATRTGFVATSYGQRRINGPAETLTLSAGQAVAPIRLTMTPSGVISGRIYSKAGQPLANVVVSAARITFQGGNRGMLAVASARTNDLGEYRIFGIPPGLYYVTATHQLDPYPRFGYGGVQAVETYARLRTETEPLPAASPTAVSVTYPDKTDAFAGTPLDVRPGDEIRNVNIIAGETQHTTRVQGTFVSAEPGQPLQLTGASMISLNGGMNRVMGGPVGGGFLTVSTFNLGFVSPGQYMMAGDGPEMAGRYFFEVRDEESIDITLKIQKGFNVPGKITVEGGGVLSASIPAFQVELRLDIPITTASGLTTAAPASDGSFILQKVLPGTYAIGLPALQYQRGAQPPRLQPALQNAYVKSIKLGSEDGLSGKLHLDAEPREPLEIVIGMNAASLEGRVITPVPGQDLSALSVALIPETRNRPETFKSTTTDKDGHFIFERIPPGNYKVFAWESVENNAWRVPEFLARDEQLGVPVQFVEGARKMLDVPIIPTK